MFKGAEYLGRIGRLATRSRSTFIAVAVIVACLILLATILATSRDRSSRFGPELGADFSAFYVAGTLMNSARPADVYDLAKQTHTYHALFPRTSRSAMQPFPYAPHFALLSRPFALLPYEASYLAWLACGLAAYLGGFTLAWRSLPELADADYRPAVLIGVSFFPFLMEGWIGGQSTALVALLVGASIFCHARGRPLTGGLLLALIAYKPTLLVLLGPMLVIGGRWRSTIGFGLGLVLAAAVGWLAVGVEGWRAYFQLLAEFGRWKTESPEMFRVFKYVDLLSASRLALGLRSPVATAVYLGVGAVAGWQLLRLWRRREGLRRPFDQLAWAVALAWTPVLTPQCGIYDATLVVPALLLMFAVSSDRSTFDDADRDAVRGVAVLVYVTAWLTQFSAMFVRLQLLTLVLIGVGLLAIAMSRRRGAAAATESLGASAL